MLLPRGHTHLVESARDGTDTLGGGGVHLEHLANDGGLIVDDLEVRCPILGLVNVAIPSPPYERGGNSDAQTYRHRATSRLYRPEPATFATILPDS